MAGRIKRACTRSTMLALVGLLAIGCSGDSEQPESPPAPDGIVADRFELRWELDGADLLLAVDTDLPDEGELSVSVSRSYYEVGNDAEYARDYLSVFEPVSRWRELRRIPLDAEAWRADLAAHQSRMAEIAAAEREAGVFAEDTIAFEVASIADVVEIRVVLHLNQDESAIRGPGQPESLRRCDLSKRRRGRDSGSRSEFRACPGVILRGGGSAEWRRSTGY